MAQAPQGAGLGPSPEEKGAADPHPGSGTLPEPSLLPLSSCQSLQPPPGLGRRGWEAKVETPCSHC